MTLELVELFFGINEIIIIKLDNDMVKEFPTEINSEASNPIYHEGGKLIREDEDLAMPKIAKTLEGLTENNVYQIANQIISDPEAKIRLKEEVMNRIFNFEPVTYDDVRASLTNDPSLSTISDITGNSLGVFRPQDIVFRDDAIFLQSRNIVEQATHYEQIPKDILADMLRMVFLNLPQKIIMKVPVSDKQKEIVDKALAGMKS